MSIRDLKLKPVPTSPGERWLRLASVVFAVGLLVLYMLGRVESGYVGAIILGWILITAASLAIVRMAAYRGRKRARAHAAERILLASSGEERPVNGAPD